MDNFFKVSLLAAAMICGVDAHAQKRGSIGNSIQNANANHWLVPQDITKQPKYTTLLPTIELNTEKNGVNITVDHYLGELNLERSSWLQVQIQENGETKLVPFMKLEDHIKDNPVIYHSRVQFQLSFQQMNDHLRQLIPNTKIEIGPGAPLYVQSLYHRFDHIWGGPARGGLMTVPGETAQKELTARPVDLDLAFGIGQANAIKFPGLNGRGQVRSRLEGEGKFQIPQFDYLRLRKELFKLATDPAAAANVFGSEWVISLEQRYMAKDPTTKLVIKDALGFPVPDPMIDTYYDNDTLDAAKKDIALRYRWTEGNRKGAWNFKPGIGTVMPSGVVYRVEYGVDTIDDKPVSLEKFANSDHPLNPFKVMKNIFPGKNVTEFLKPSVKLTDYRYKFKLKHTSGLIIEVSLDDVRAENLRASGRYGRYYQLELDIDHLSTTSSNVKNGGGVELNDLEEIKPWLLERTAAAGLAGKLDMHEVADLAPDSPIMSNPKNKADFEMATVAIVQLRDKIVKNWAPGAQKYAMAVRALGLLPFAEMSASVKESHRGIGILYQQHGPVMTCKKLFSEGL